MISDERLKFVLAQNEDMASALIGDGMNADEYVEMADITRELLALRASHSRFEDVLKEVIRLNETCTYHDDAGEALTQLAISANAALADA